MSYKPKARIAKIFNNLENSKSENLSHKTYIVNLNGSLTLDSVTKYNDESVLQGDTACTTIEGNPKNIFITGDEGMMLCTSQEDTFEYEWPCDTALTQLAPDTETVHLNDYFPITQNDQAHVSDLEWQDLGISIIIDPNLEPNTQVKTVDFAGSQNIEELLDGPVNRRIIVTADIHKEPNSPNNHLTSSFGNIVLPDNEATSLSQVSHDSVQRNGTSQKMNPNISPVSPSILMVPSDELTSKLRNDTSIEDNITDINAIEDNLEQDTQKRKRRKRSQKDLWEKNRNIKLREEGKEYHGRVKERGVWKYDKIKKERKIKPKCDCRLSTKNTKVQCMKINEEKRQKIFDRFWKLTWKEKKMYIRTLVVVKPKARNRGTGTESKKKSSLELYLEKDSVKIRVCKTMFMNTLAVGEWALKNWARTNNENQEQPKEKFDKTESKKQQIKRFLDQLPKLESHYCRKNSSKLYLETMWESKTQLLKAYNNVYCKENNGNSVSIATFSEVFEEMNLSLFRPKKDACDLCEEYKTKNVTEAVYRAHIVKKECARREKQRDKESDNEVLTMDLQSVQLCPKSNVSSLYFKTKLAVHNFTAYDVKRSDGYCFLWNETEGGLTANEFASIIIRMLDVFVEKNNIQQGSKIILYSDGCTYQNRNATLSNALLNFSMQKHITVVQKILEKGHTQMEADSMHSVIERQVKKKKINVLAEYAYIAKTACKKNPYYVKYLDHKFFKNFETSLNFYKSIRPGKKSGDPVVTDLRQLTYSPSGQINYRLGFSEDCPELPLPCRKRKFTSVNVENLPALYTERLKIKKSKFDHLQQLKVTMESDFHSFYDSIPHED